MLIYFYPEDGGGTFLRNVSPIATRRRIPEDGILQFHIPAPRLMCFQGLHGHRDVATEHNRTAVSSALSKDKACPFFLPLSFIYLSMPRCSNSHRGALKDFKLITTSSEHWKCSQRSEADHLIMAAFGDVDAIENHIKKAAA
jgi:hypothetical protein